MLSGTQVRDYVDIVRRRKWWVILTALSISVGTGVVAWCLPAVYSAETVILVDPQKVPDTYVPATVTTSIVDRLSTIQQQVVSESQLRRLIETMKLYPERKVREIQQDIVAHMRKAIRVDVVSQGGRQTSTFRIAFEDSNPIVAANVANQLASMFIEQNLRVREQQSYGTADFLQGELTKTKAELDKKEQELSALKRSNIGDLPESKQYHLQALETLRAQLRTSQDRVERAQQDKVYLQSLLSTSAPTIDLDKQNASPYQVEIGRLETTLSQLRSRYGSSHPDVRKVQVELDKVKALEEEATKARSGAPPDTALNRQPHNPVLESQIEKMNEVIEQETKNQAELQPQVALHMHKLQNVPIFEQQIAGVMRDYEALRAYYVSLLDKKFAADTASALESRQKAERFVVLDPAIVAEKPSAPNRPLITFAGLIAGMLGGICLAFVLELMDESLRSEMELKRLTVTPVFACIPQVWTRREKRYRAIGIIATAVAVVVCSAVAGWFIALLGSRGV